jgi:hypothetical protein
MTWEQKPIPRANKRLVPTKKKTRRHGDLAPGTCSPLLATVFTKSRQYLSPPRLTSTPFSLSPFTTLTSTSTLKHYCLPNYTTLHSKPTQIFMRNGFRTQLHISILSLDLPSLLPSCFLLRSSNLDALRISSIYHSNFISLHYCGGVGASKIWLPALS